jgi:cephalosporin-C deacetylase-like acetyl esterase
MNYREKVLESLGHFPDRVELDPVVEEQTDYGTHLFQLVRYNVELDERINAYLLLPKNLKDKNPAILASHQHAGEYYLGKSEPAGLSKNLMYHYGLDLCLRGYVVLCPDHLGFEDRRPLEYKRVENKDLDGGNYERLLFCKYILNGSSLQTKYLSDLCRGVDFLQSLSFVDGEKIGAIGHSLGGQETLWLTWYDSRIKAAVSSCGFSQIRNIIRDGINHNFAMFIYGFLQYGDISNLLCDLAPTPFLMTSGDVDAIFPLDGVYEIAEAARKAYTEKGMEDCFKSILFEGGHSFPVEVKEKAYQWLDRFLK